MVAMGWLLAQGALPTGVRTPMAAVPALLVAVGALAALATVLGAIVVRRKRDTAQVDAVAQRYHFEPVTTSAELARVKGDIHELFGEGARIRRVLRHRDASGLTTDLVHLKIPLFRVDEGGEWDETVQESQEKLMVIVTGFGAVLPTFRLMPNSWALSTVRGKESNLFHDIEPFGFWNYVIGYEAARVQRLISGEAMHLLRRNRWLTIDARHEFMAFYSQDERPLPRDLAAFLEKCQKVAKAIAQRLHEPPVASQTAVA